MMIKRYKIYTVIVAMSWLALGCNTDHESTTLQRDVELHFTAASVIDGTTRADAGDTYNDALTSGSNIGVYIYGYVGSTRYDISTLQPAENTLSTTWVYSTVGSAVTVTENNQTFKISNLLLTSHDKAPKYPQKPGTGNGDMDNVKVFAVFPNNPSFKPSGNSTEYYDFTAELDQRTESNIIASDLMTNDITTYTKEQTEHVSLRLNLQHRMAKVHVNFIPKAGGDLTAENMPTTFKVMGVYRSLRITPVSGTVALNTTVAQTTVEAPLLGTTGQSFFVAPQQISSATPWLKFDIRGSGQFKGITGCTFTPSSAVTLEAGKCYQVNVTVDIDFASVTGTITTWNQETLSYDTVVL